MAVYAPSGFATSQLQYGVLVNDLNTNNLENFKRLIPKYGVENYAMVMEALGNAVLESRTDNKTFYHYEDRSLHNSVSAFAQVTGAGAGASLTIRVAAADHYESGAKSPVRVGEVVEVVSSGVQGQITAINTSTPSAHTFTVTPLNTADTIATAGSANVLIGELFVFRGAVNIGEGSDKISGHAPVYDKITNTTTEHRDDFTISDVADMEKQQISIGPNGEQYYRPYALDKMNRRFMNHEFVKIMEGVSVNNISGTTGTIGVIPRAQASGQTQNFTIGSLALSDLQSLTRALNFYGAPGEYHALMDVYSKQVISNLLFSTFKNTFNAVSYESVGRSKEAAVAYGFDTYRMDNITLHMFTNPMFNAEMMYKRTPTQGDYYRYFTLLIPQGKNSDSKTGRSDIPSFEIVRQMTPSGNKIETTETGMFAPSNKTTKAERTISMLCYTGVRVFAASQYGILKGTA